MMTPDEIKRVVDLHGAWLRVETGGARADLTDAVLTGTVLRGADLTDAVLTGADLTRAVLKGAVLKGAVMTGADLRDADLDHSAIPLSCGGLKWRIDRCLLAQLLYHVCSHEVTGCDEWPALRETLLPLANEMHRTDVPRLTTSEANP